MCEFIGKYASDQLKRLAEVESHAAISRFSIIGQSLIESAPTKVLEAVHEEATEFFGASEIVYVDAAGNVNGKLKMLPIDAVSEIAAWLRTNVASDLFFTNRLSDTLESFAPLSKLAAGLLSVRVNNGYLVIFRPEHVETIVWGGNPDKAVESEGISHRLHPRHSFEAWREQVKLQSQRWSDGDLFAARMLGSLLDASTIDRNLNDGLESGELNAPKMRESLTRSISLLEELAADEMVETVLSMRLNLLRARYQEMLEFLQEAS
jgi:light-regulated signal transduction histidine kinase (bacteriophytochrome)